MSFSPWLYGWMGLCFGFSVGYSLGQWWLRRYIRKTYTLTLRREVD